MFLPTMTFPVQLCSVDDMILASGKNAEMSLGTAGTSARATEFRRLSPFLRLEL
jgi:hypothetical protein